MIVEILMPERDGLEAIHAARARWPHVRVIATTAGRQTLGVDYLLDLARHMGADLALSKAEPLERFAAALDALLQR